MPSTVQLKLATFKLQHGENVDDAWAYSQSKEREIIQRETLSFHKLELLGFTLVFEINILRLKKINPIQRIQ